MATSKDKIIKYLIEKNDFIFRKTRLKYFYKADYGEIKGWSDEDCDKIWETLIHGEKRNIGNLCPWCIIRDYKNNTCSECQYGKRHGKCYNPDKGWYVIKNRLDDKINDEDCIKEFEKIINKINEV